MISRITLWIMDLIQTHGGWSVFIGVMIESIIVPIPSPLIIMGAGAMLIEPNIAYSRLFFDLTRLIILPGAIASTLGAYIGYGIGYLGGKPFIEKLRRFLGFGWEEVEKFQDRLKGRNIGFAIFMLRALPIVPLSLISAAAGALRWPVASFTYWTFLGSIPRCFVLGYLGWLTRETYFSLAKELNFIETLISGLILVSVFIFIFWLRSRFSIRNSSKT